MVAEVAFEDRHVGAPGIAHGGAVATVFDDLFGFLLYAVAELAVTRSLQVDTALRSFCASRIPSELASSGARVVGCI